MKPIEAWGNRDLLYVNWNRPTVEVTKTKTDFFSDLSGHKLLYKLYAVYAMVQYIYIIYRMVLTSMQPTRMISVHCTVPHTYHGQSALVELLLAEGFDVNAPNSVDGATPLHRAAHSGQAAVLESHLLDMWLT